MNTRIIGVLLCMLAPVLHVGAQSLAQEIKSPTQLTLGILAEHNVSVVLPSVLILDERGMLGGMTFTVTNHNKKAQGGAIDKLSVKEGMEPGETKVIKTLVTDLDGIGTDQSVFPYYNQLDKAHIGGLLYVKR